MNACLPVTASAMRTPSSVPAFVPPAVLQLRSSAGLYGADRMVLTLNHALAGSNVHSRLLSINNYRMREQPLHDTARAMGQDADLLPCRGRFDTRTVRALKARIDASNAPLLHAHDYKSAFYAWLASRHRNTPLMATLHGWVEGSRSQRLYNRLELVLLRRFDALVVVANQQIEPLVRAGIARERIHQVDNGIEPPPEVADSVASTRRKFGLEHASFVFGAVARLSPEKNLSMLLDAFVSLALVDAGVVLVVAGDGPERAALEAHAGRLGIASSVHFLGARADMARVYRLFDCLVLPSLSEGMPLVVLEAMARALPVLASSVGDVPRLLANSTYGRLVSPGDPQALQAGMQAALAEPGLRDQRARSYVLHRHSPTAMADHYLDIYQSLTACDRGRKTS